MQGRIEGSCANCRYFANDGECSKYDVDVYRSDWCLDHHMDWDKQRKIERPGLVKTIENCRLIKRAVRAGVGTPNIGLYSHKNCEITRKAYSEVPELDEMIRVWKVCCDGTWRAFDTPAAAIEFLTIEIEAEAEDLEPGRKTRDYCIEAGEMTKEEYLNLPEFTGF